MNIDDFAQNAKKIGCTLSKEQLAQFSTLLHELAAWNAHTNLTAIRTDDEIVRKHFLDSLSVLQAVPPEARTLIDVGTGAGFPGLPIAIARPNLAVTLLESVSKKCEFIEHAAAILELSQTRVVCARAEDIGHNGEHRERHDVAVARAVAELRTLAEYCLPLVRVGGVFIAQKNAGQDEIKAAENAIKTLGGAITKCIPIETDGLENRQLIVISKVFPTPQDYPRRSGIPAKKPL